VLESFNRSKVGVSYCTPTLTEKIFELSVYVFDRNRQINGIALRNRCIGCTKNNIICTVSRDHPDNANSVSVAYRDLV